MWVVASFRALLVLMIVCAAARAQAQAASCYDGVQNGPESDVDCGGDCIPCDLERRCVMARDCMSGRCVKGQCEEHAWRKGDALPPGYHVETSNTDAAASARRAGILFFGLSYGAAYVGALALPQRLSWLYAPVVGPWAALPQDDLGGIVRALLVADGAMQAAGAALIIGGIVGRGQQLVRGEMASARPRPRATIVPRTLVTKSELGVAVSGSF